MIPPRNHAQLTYIKNFVYDDLIRLNRSMFHSIDPTIKQFYIEMGYSQSQVIRAYEYSVKKGIDILDALSLTSKSASNSINQKQEKPNNKQKNAPQPKRLQYSSFLLPINQIKSTDYETLYSKSSKFNPLNSRAELREAGNPVGLLNISNCCYLNSLTQCYFLMGKFKQIILSAQPLDNIAQILSQNKTKLKRVKNQYQLLRKLKIFFTKMSLSSKKYLDPSEILQNLVDSVGQKLSYGQEKDLSEINIMITQRLSEGLTFCKNFYQPEEDPFFSIQASFIDEGQGKNRYNSIFNPQKGPIKKLFYGTKVEYYEEKIHPHQEPIVNDFTGIFLNPRFRTLQSALDQEFNFSVEINGESLKKRMFIRQQPQYLFMYINRAQYDRQEQQAMKNDQNFTFDFVFYLDRYLEKYKKERDQKDEEVCKLIDSRNKIKDQLSNLHILYEKMADCYAYADKLDGWQDKLPSQEQFEQQEAILTEKLLAVEKDLKQVESRNDQYHLVYIFVHRGDAVSGHYWGYGRNGNRWYRFDINCRLIDQDQIMIDLEKSSGTPYALLYVKRDNIPQMTYNYHLSLKTSHNNTLYKLFDGKLKDDIVRQNILLHQEYKSKQNEAIKKKSYNDYINRFTTSKKVFKKFQQGKIVNNHLENLPYCNNYSLFLLSKQQDELFKFSIFEQSLLSASNNRVNCINLMSDNDLLPRIQKKFKLKCKGELNLKNYALIGKDIQKNSKYFEQYQLSNFEHIWGVLIVTQILKLKQQLDKQLPKAGEFIKIQLEGSIASSLLFINKYIKIRQTFFKSQQYKIINQFISQPLYVSQVNNEISKLVILQLLVYGFKFGSLQQYIDISDSCGAQAAYLNAGNTLDLTQLKVQPISSLQIQMQQLVKKYHLANRRLSTKQSSNLKSEKRPSTKQSQGLESSSSFSPLKSALILKQSSKEKRQSEQSQSSSNGLVVFDVRETWKIEQLNQAKPNFDYSSKVMQFLKGFEGVVRVYKQISKLNRPLTIIQLSDQGLWLNRPKFEQSLI